MIQSFTMAARSLGLPLVLMAALAAPVLVDLMATPALAQSNKGNNGNGKGNTGPGNQGKGPNPSRGNAGQNAGNNVTSGGVKFSSVRFGS